MSVRMDSDWEILRPAPGEAGELRYTWAEGQVSRQQICNRCLMMLGMVGTKCRWCKGHVEALLHFEHRLYVWQDWLLTLSESTSPLDFSSSVS